MCQEYFGKVVLKCQASLYIHHDIKRPQKHWWLLKLQFSRRDVTGANSNMCVHENAPEFVNHIYIMDLVEYLDYGTIDSILYINIL